MQRPAKAWTSVRFRPRPPVFCAFPTQALPSLTWLCPDRQNFGLGPWRPSLGLLMRQLQLDDVRLFRGSSAVEQPAVNRLVVGSNPTRGANHSGVRPGEMGDKTYLRHG